jgi:hypothetical protein
VLDGFAQRASLVWQRLHRRGVERGTVVKLPGKLSRCCAHFLRQRTRCTAACHQRRHARHRARPQPRPPQPGGPCGATTRLGTTRSKPPEPAGSASLRLPHDKTATSPANRGGFTPALTGGDRHAELGVLVQPSPSDGRSGLHPTRRSRGKLLAATHWATCLGELTTYPNQPPQYPGRFRPSSDPWSSQTPTNQFPVKERQMARPQPSLR